MKNEEEGSQEKGKGLRIAIVAVSVLALFSFAATFYQEGVKHEAVSAMNESKLDAERLLGEKLHLEKNIVDLTGEMGGFSDALVASERTVADLRRRVEAAATHTRWLERAARKSNKLEGEVAALKLLKQQLETQLVAATTNGSDLQEALALTRAERDALAAELEVNKEGARMVNNAEVEALQGRKNRLTVVARRTKEIRMAFDLPEELAKGASFKIVTPGGRNYTGAHAAVSMSLNSTSNEPTASLATVTMVEPKERAARVHLKFTPETKLEAGTYRIDVMSGGAYLNTVLLNLR